MKEVSTYRPKSIRLLLLALSLLFACSFEVSAETNPPVTDANIVGHVVSKNTHEHLPFITIMVQGTMIQTSTDATGHYMLKDLPTGSHRIEARSAGYQTVVKEVTLKANNTVELNFEIEEDVIALSEVVVSSNRNQMLRRQAPSLVNVLSGKTFDITQSVCLAQGLNFQPGVRTEDNCANCGFSQVRINGLDGHYSQILLDSRPVFSSLQGVYGLEQIPANMIERVEVVRGGGSALFGASAIGGTINIITKEPLTNFAEMGHTLMKMGKGNTYDNVTTMNASVVADNHKAGLYVYGQSRHRSAYDHDGDGYSDLPKITNKTIGLSSFLRLSPYSKLSLQYHGINEFRRGGNNLDLPAHESNIAEQLDHQINGGSLNYSMFTPNEKNRLQGYISFEHVSRKSYYGGIGDASADSKAAAMLAYSMTRDLNLVGGMQYVHSFDNLLFMPADLTVGAEYSYDALRDHALGLNTLLDQKVRIGSMYLQNEWKNDRFTFLLGGRMDKHNLISHAIFSPRANLRYNPTKDINLRLSYAGGFRAPQAFDEDLHTQLAGGERIKTRLSKDLKEERSHSFSLSGDIYHRFGQIQTNILVEAFYNRLNNVFALRRLAEKDAHGDGLQERYNAHSAQVYGLNIEGKAAFSQRFSLQAGLTMQKSQYNEAIEWDEEAPKEKRMMRTPDTYGYFTATITPIKRFNISLTGNYTGSMLVGHAAGSGVTKPVAVNTPSFFVLNSKLSYDWRVHDLINLQLNAGIQNITGVYQKDIDRGYERDANYIYGPSLPRSIYIGMKVSY